MFKINRPLKNGTTVIYENKIGIIIGSKKWILRLLNYLIHYKL